jgi:hypothetical protein
MLFIAVLASTGSGVLSAPACTQERLPVEGAPVTFSYCIAGPLHSTGSEELLVPVTETYTAPGGTLSRTSELHFIAGEGVSRVIESLDLTKLGLAGTLHLTLAYSRGVVRLEGALLTPGAITIK